MNYVTGSSCRDDGITCGDGQCVHVSMFCDFVQNCENGDDEKECGNHLYLIRFKLLEHIVFWNITRMTFSQGFMYNPV